MSKLKEFERTMDEAKKEAWRKLNYVRREETNAIIKNSTDRIEFCIGKLLENATDDFLKANKEHIDSIYHNVGMIKGTL